MTIPTADALHYLSTVHGVPVHVDHTGGGNYVIGLGACLGYDEEQGTDRHEVNIGPVYREADGTFTGEAGDLYIVSASPARADVIVHITEQILPVVLPMLGIEDVTVSDPCVSLDDISSALGDGWSIGCLGGNIYGVTTRDGATMITVDHGQSVAYSPAHIIIGRQGPDDAEWRELWSGDIWSADELPAIVADHI
jgi:hypothetical protein